MGLGGFKNVKQMEFQKVEIWKKEYVSDMIPYFFLYFLKYFHDKYGEPGSTMSPKNRKFWKFPESSKKYWNMTGDLN